MTGGGAKPLGPDGSAPGPVSRSTDKREVALLLAGLITVFTVPAVLALSTVQQPRPLMPWQSDPTPLGYTWSLSLFLVPALVLGSWYARFPVGRVTRRAFWWTVGVLPAVGFLLDFLLAHKFFSFVYEEATLGIWIPVLGGETVPVEEFAFYALGFVAILLIYVWADEYWLDRYNVPDYRQTAHERGIDRVVVLHWPSLLVGGGLVLAGVAIKRLSDPSGGFPGYFAFLVATAVTPSLLLFPTALPFINWRALSLTFVIVVPLSLLWEATLAIPYQWWGYREDQMLGLFVDAWTGLPVEAVLLWMVVSYTTVIVYESMKVLVMRRAELSFREAVMGVREGDGARA